MRRLDFYRLWDINMCQTLHGVGYTQCSIKSQWVRSTRCRKIKLICLITHIFERPRLTYVWFFGTLHSSVLFRNIMSTLFFVKNYYAKQEIRSANSESLLCNCFIFDHVTFTQFKICCRVQNFMKTGWFFTEIWRYIDFQNGARPPSWNCFTIIRDHPRSLCCWPQLPVKLHVNLIHRSEDIAIWSFRIFGLKCLLRPQMGRL